MVPFACSLFRKCLWLYSFHFHPIFNSQLLCLVIHQVLLFPSNLKKCRMVFSLSYLLLNTAWTALPFACLCQLLFCAFVTLLSHCVNWLLLGHALLSAVHRDTWPCASVQFSSVAQSCPTLCDPMNHSTPGLPVQHQLPEFTKLISIESVMPFNHLILCRPFLLLSSIFPSVRVFSNKSALCIR